MVDRDVALRQICRRGLLCTGSGHRNVVRISNRGAVPVTVEQLMDFLRTWVSWIPRLLRRGEIGREEWPPHSWD